MPSFPDYWFDPNMLSELEKIYDKYLLLIKAKIRSELENLKSNSEKLKNLYDLEHKFRNFGVDIFFSVERNAFEKETRTDYVEERSFNTSIICWIKSEIEYYKNLGTIDVSKRGRYNKNKKSDRFITLTLEDIWKGKANSYQKCMNNLLIKNRFIDFHPFITLINGKYKWNKQPHTWQKFLGAFLYSCYKKEFIEEQFSINEWKKIIKNTFEVEPASGNNFSFLHSKMPIQKYLNPFKEILNV